MMRKVFENGIPKTDRYHCKKKLATKSPSISYDYFMNLVSKNRRPAPTRELTSLIGKLPEETINLGIGFPNGNTFPFKEINISLKDDTKIKIIGKSLQTALQYLPTSGYTKLINLLKELQDKIHGRQSWTEKNLLICNGSQEGLSKAVEMIHCVGDPVIMQHPIYSGIIDLFRPNNAEFILTEQDSYGIIPILLRQNLENRKKLGKAMPKVMYVNSTCGNPTGVTITDERKKEIYQLACEFNFLILEDDPYYYLSFTKENMTSFLSLDTESRVLRFDSFSKMLSSGLRLGFITGPTVLVRAMELHIQVSTMHASALSQVIVHQLLEQWKYDGFQKHIGSVQRFYKMKRDLMLQLAEKYLKDVAEWNVPSSGFFLWLKLKFLKDVRNLALKKCLEKHIVVAPGYIFYLDNEKPCPYLRLSYSTATKEEIEIAFSKLAIMIQEEMDKTSSQKK